MQEMKFRIDWLAFTVHAIDGIADYIWERFFLEYLGSLQEMDHGGRGYKTMYKAELGAKMYKYPSDGVNHFHIEFPGQASGCLPKEVIANLFSWLEEIECGSNQAVRYAVKRLDLAFDHIPFTPEMFYQAIENHQVRSLTQRESLQEMKSPFKQREDGSGEGQETTYFGSPQSTRRARVYNKRGPVRFEFVAKHERADAIARSMFTNESALWPELAIGHIRDFMDIYKTSQKKEIAPWWLEFVEDAKRACIVVHKSKDINEMRIRSWLEAQVAPWWFVINRKDPEWIEALLIKASKKLKPHHKRILGKTNEE